MLIITSSALFASLLVSILLIRYKGVGHELFLDSDLCGIQKFHTSPVPRIGGIPIFIGFVITISLSAYHWDTYHVFFILLASIPAFAAGLIEDLTKRIAPLSRLIATFLAATLGFWLLKIGLVRLSIPGIDYILKNYWFLSLCLTIIAVGGVAHAINIIDGYNGLASMIVIMIFLSLAYVSFKVGNILLCSVSLGLVGSVTGFFLLNYPKGLIFLGDGGAYLVGFLVAELSVLLVAFHPEVSPWFPMLLVIYPVIETLFSIYRRKIIRKSSASMPDGLHLHTLIYRRVIRQASGCEEKLLFNKNSLTAPYLWFLSSVSVIPACIFWNNTPALIIITVLFVMVYVITYSLLINFKFPKWLIIKRSLKNR